MLVRGYTKEIFRPECNPSFQSVHCIAHLREDITDVLPYLNTVLGGTHYSADPPSLTLKVHGKLITLHPREIAINALEDEGEAERILEWLVKEINETWERRGGIQPTTTNAPRPKILEILRRLPRTNCKECGQPTCTVFATLLADGAKEPGDCPRLGQEAKGDLEGYLARFEVGEGW
jgi:ArsR family metal-binding transcriptional regulator